MYLNVIRLEGFISFIAIFKIDRKHVCVCMVLSQKTIQESSAHHLPPSDVSHGL